MYLAPQIPGLPSNFRELEQNLLPSHCLTVDENVPVTSPDALSTLPLMVRFPD